MKQQEHNAAESGQKEIRKSINTAAAVVAVVQKSQQHFLNYFYLNYLALCVLDVGLTM